MSTNPKPLFRRRPRATPSPLWKQEAHAVQGTATASAASTWEEPATPDVAGEAHETTKDTYFRSRQLYALAHPAVPYPTADGPSAAERALFERLYADEWTFVRRTLERYGVPMRDADDIAQEVFTVALRRIADCDAARSARPWLFVIAVQLAANYRKLARHRIEPLATEAPDQPSAVPDAEAMFAAGEERALVHLLIGQLRPPLRAVLVMHDLEERPMTEIADALGILPKTGYARLQLAREEARRKAQALSPFAHPLRMLRRLTKYDLCEIHETVLAYGRRSRRPSIPGKPQSRRKIAIPQRYPRCASLPRCPVLI